MTCTNFIDIHRKKIIIIAITLLLLAVSGILLGVGYTKNNANLLVEGFLVLICGSLCMIIWILHEVCLYCYSKTYAEL